MKLDETDLMILRELHKDSRISLRSLARRINLSAPSVTERVRRMEADKIIEGYTIKLNKKEIGFPIESLITITIRAGQYESFIRMIKDHPYSDWCYRISGDACFLVKLSVPTLSDIESFINQVSPYAMTSTSIVFSEVSLTHSII